MERRSAVTHVRSLQPGRKSGSPGKGKAVTRFWCSEVHMSLEAWDVTDFAALHNRKDMSIPDQGVEAIMMSRC